LIRFMLHTPVNVRGRMLDYLKASLKDLEREVGDEIQLFTPHDPQYSSDCTEEWLPASIERGIMPDIIITHATEFASLKREQRIELFSSLPGQYEELKPIRKELSKLKDSLGIFYPISVTPLAMIYNAENVKEEELKHSWADLFNEKFKVIFPERNKPLCRAAGGFLKANFPEEFPEFEERVTYSGTPANMTRLIASGEYDMGMTLLPFAGIGQQGRVKINKTKEGYIPLPQTIVWKKGASKSLMTFADIFRGRDMQSYLAEQDTWTVREDMPIRASDQDMKQVLEWKGWDFYLDAVDEFDKYSV
jgi:hypothetical protein